MKLMPLLVAMVLTLSSVAPVFADSIASKVENSGGGYIKITGLLSRERNGFLNLQIEMTNTDNENRRAHYRVKWLDESGFQVWDDEPWKPLMIHGKQMQNIQAMAPTSKARDFRIQFSTEDP